MSDTETSILKIRLNDAPRLRDETGTPIDNRADLTRSPIREIALETRGAHALAPTIDIDRLYEAVAGTSSQMVRALELLRQASDTIADARKSESPIEADRFAQRVQLILPKLFNFRSIGDGFGIIVTSLHFAFVNLHGTPLTPDQLNVIWRVLRELRARPAISLEAGIQYVEELEERGLEVDPPDVGDLLGDSESSEND